MRNLLFLIFIACAILTTTTAADVQHGTPQELTSTEYYKHYFKSGDSYIAGQPSATAIRRLGQQRHYGRRQPANSRGNDGQRTSAI